MAIQRVFGSVWEVPDQTYQNTASNTVSRSLEEKHEEWISSEDFDLDATGATDNATKFTNFLATAGRKLVRPGTYRVDSTVTIAASNTEIVFEDGASIDFTNATLGDRLFQISGTEGATVSLTANASLGDTSVTVGAGDEAAFSADAWVFLKSQDVYDSQNVGVFEGEFLQVSGVSSGVVNFKTAVRGLTYTTGNSATISPLTLKENISIEGGEFTGRQDVVDNTNAQGMIQVLFGNRFSLRFARLEGFNGTAVQINNTINSRVIECDISKSQRPNSGYGVSVVDASHNTLVERNVFTQCRHAFTTVQTSTNFGVNRDTYVVKNRVDGSVNTGDALDTHGASENVNFIENFVTSSTSQGINFECTSGSIVGNRIFESASNGIGFHTETDRSGEVLIEGNICRNDGGNGIDARQGTRGTPIASPRGVVISNNKCYDSGGIGIAAIGFNIDLEGVVIANNYVENPGSLNGAIFIQEANNFVIANNMVTLVPEDGQGLSVFDCQSGNVSDNTVEWDTPTVGATGEAIIINAGSSAATDRVIVSGNTIRNPGVAGSIRGIVIDADATNCMIHNNIVNEADIGIEVNGPRTKVDGNHIFNTDSQAILATGANNCSFNSNNVVTNGGNNAIFLDNCDDCVVNGNQITDVDVDGIGINNSNRIVVSGNSIALASGNTVNIAIHLTASVAHADVVVDGNFTDSPGGAGTSDGIVIDADYDWVIVDSNNFRNMGLGINPSVAVGNNLYGDNLI